MLDLRQYRTTSAGLPDLLNYAALIDSGVIQCKDGSLLAAFSFRGEDASASSAADKNYITSHVARNFNRFDANLVAIEHTLLLLSKPILKPYQLS